MAKRTRERLVKERRALKLEKKQAAREAKANGGIPPDAADADAAEADPSLTETAYRTEMPVSEEAKE